MPSHTLLDLSTLLQPITEGQPSGPDMLFSSDFDEIKAARLQEDMSLDQGEWVTDRKEANLPFVVQRCTQLLKDQTKDLRLAMWLTDALGSLHGLNGLTQGYQLMNALALNFWDSVHPAPEEGDMSARVGNISWLLKRTEEQLGRAQLLRAGGTSISMLTWQTAVALDQAVRRHPSEASSLVSGKTTLEDLERLRMQVPSGQLRALGTELAQFRAALEAFDGTLDTKLGREAPSFASLREILDHITHLARRWGADDAAGNGQAVAPSVEPAAQPGAAAKVHSTPEAEASTHMDSAAPRPLRTRADAIDMLQQAAAFFERTEPSSPAAYMAQKAARWAQLPLHEWLKHVVKSDDELAQLEEMLGVTSHSRVQRND